MINRTFPESFGAVPESTVRTLKDYIERGVPVGGFLEAVICNDLIGAFCRADRYNTQAMADIASLIYNHAPCGSWGSAEAYQHWLQKHDDYRKGMKDGD